MVGAWSQLSERMTVARLQWSDFGSIWKTVREVDINAVRREAERDVTIAIIGQQAALWHVDRLLREGPNRYPLHPEQPYFLPLGEAARYLEYVKTADVLVLALDAHGTLSEAEVAGLRTLAEAPRPRQVVFLLGAGAAALYAGPWSGEGAPPGPEAANLTTWGPYLDQRLATAIDTDAPGAGMKLCGAVLDALPHDLRLAAARRLPGLRPLFAARLTTEVSVSNAAVALASGVPSIVPILGIPLAAADTIILTKNQVWMVYRLALACGAEPDFQKRMIEITPVIGGAVVWRQIAGALVGLVPGYGIVPKTAVAFGGTYVVGLAATRWYETGLLTDEERKRITAEAAATAKDTASAMVAQAKVAGEKARTAGDTVGTQVKSAAQTVAERARTTRDSMLAQAKVAGEKARTAGRKVARRDKDAAPPE
jgi:hypothetical protein